MLSKFIIGFLSLMLLSACFGGSSGGSNGSSANNNTATAASITLFSANPLVVNSNETTTLTWSSQDASECTASGAWSGPKSASDQEISETIGPMTQTSTFNMMCTGPGGDSTVETVTVDVIPIVPAASVTITANPTTILFNGSTELTWVTSNADTCNASGAWSGPIAANATNTQTIGPLTQTSSFEILCTGPGGSSSPDSVTVNVGAPPTGPTVTLSADPTIVGINGSTQLTWSSTDATSCTASGNWSGTKVASANPSTEGIGPLTSDSTFQLQCTGPGGTSQPVSVNVTVIPAPTASLTADPNPVVFNSSTTLSWSSTNADSCLAIGGWSAQTIPSGAENIGPLTSDTSYSIECTGLGGQVTATEYVTVLVNNNGTATLSWTPPDSNADDSRPLSDLNGYRIYYRSLPNGQEQVIPINSGLTSYILTGLQSGTYSFSITAIDTSGNESDRSNTANLTIN